MAEKISLKERLKSQKALLISVICGVLSVCLILAYVRGKEKELSVGPEIEITAAKADIQSGTTLNLTMIAKKKFPEKFLPPNVIMSTDHKIVLGQQVTGNIPAGQPILWSDVGMESGGIKLATTMNPHERAVTIAVDDVNGVAGLLKPNDRVDIVGTFQLPPEASKMYEMPSELSIGEGIQSVTKILLQNITILATGQTLGKSGSTARIGRKNDKKSYADSLEQSLSQGESSYRTITVAVTPAEAEMLIFAMRRGELSLILRHPEDIEIIEDLPIVSFNSILGLEKKLTSVRKARVKGKPAPVPQKETEIIIGGKKVTDKDF
ncbi:MAG: Flp pilus assembly protein CpaB [bacterium]|nr:Flp pilus assembly protein CpaB [bacterium]